MTPWWNTRPGPARHVAHRQAPSALTRAPARMRGPLLNPPSVNDLMRIDRAEAASQGAELT